MTTTSTLTETEIRLMPPLLNVEGIARQIVDKREMFGTAFTFTEGITVYDPAHPKAGHHGYRDITRGEYVRALRFLRREQERKDRNARLDEADRIAAALAAGPVVPVPSMDEAPDPKLVEAHRVAMELAKDREALQRRRQDAIAAINRIARSRS